MSDSAILLIHSPDRRGLVAAVANFIADHNGNVLHADQHQDNPLGLFFMRVEWDLQEFDLELSEFAVKFASIATRFQMQWTLAQSTERPKVALFVSKQDHCLVDLLHRYQIQELNCDLSLIVSNHTATKSLAEFHGIPFHYIPMTPETKVEAEAQQLELLATHKIELVVLARYMQVLSADFVAHYPQQIINVHHSFLPAFRGARPYHQAYQQGVKLIGATSHYVTADLDEGPIIEQDVVRISHRDRPEDLIQKGRDLEKVVLARAVRWHLEHRVLVYANKTVVFD